MISVQQIMQDLLFERAAELAELTGLQMSWPNKVFPGKSSQGVNQEVPGSYLEVNLVPNISTRLFVNAPSHIRPGLLQISIKTPLDTTVDPSMSIAGIVVAHFPVGLDLYRDGIRVSITKSPDIGPTFKDEPSWMTPVSIYYESLN